MLRIAHEARGFVYTIVDLSDLQGIEVLSAYYPTEEVINSFFIARKLLTHKNIHNRGHVYEYD